MIAFGDKKSKITVNFIVSFLRIALEESRSLIYNSYLKKLAKHFRIYIMFKKMSKTTKKKDDNK